MLAVGVHAVVFLDIRLHVAQEVFDELISAIRRPPGEPHPGMEWTCMAGRHSNDHRHRFPFCNQVIKDEPSPADTRPGIIAIPGTVEKIEDRVFVASRLVARRSIDVHAPETMKGGRVVGDRSNGAMWDVSCVHEVRAGYAEEAPCVLIRFADGRIARIHQREAVHDVGVPVCPRLDRTDRRLPDAIGQQSHPSEHIAMIRGNPGYYETLRNRRNTGIHPQRQADGTTGFPFRVGLHTPSD